MNQDLKVLAKVGIGLALLLGPLFGGLLFCTDKDPPATAVASDNEPEDHGPTPEERNGVARAIQGTRMLGDAYVTTETPAAIVLSIRSRRCSDAFIDELLGTPQMSDSLSERGFRRVKCVRPPKDDVFSKEIERP